MTLRDDYEANWNRWTDDGQDHVLSQADALTKKPKTLPFILSFVPIKFSKPLICLQGDILTSSLIMTVWCHSQRIEGDILAGFRKMTSCFHFPGPVRMSTWWPFVRWKLNISEDFLRNERDPKNKKDPKHASCTIMVLCSGSKWDVYGKKES